MRLLPLLLIDILLIAFATVFAIVLRDNLHVSEARILAIEPYLAFTLGVAFVILPILGTNRTVWQYSTSTDYLRIVFGAVTIVGGAVVIGFGFNRMDELPRALPILQALLITFALVGVRISWRLWLSTVERPTLSAAPGEKADYDTILVVGLGALTELYLKAATQFAPSRLRIAGLLADDELHVGRMIGGHSIIGAPQRVAEVLRVLEVHGVFVNRIVVAVSFDKLSSQAQEALLNIERASNIDLEFLFEQMGLGPRSASATECATRSVAAAGDDRVFYFHDDDIAAIKRRTYWRIKRIIDIVGALSLLAIVSPLMLIVAILIAIDVGSPLVFWQQRPGLYGLPFRVYKFRTMASAHKLSGERTPDSERTSRIGRFMRLTRLDEFPQLVNILIGEMSFIGPRPLLPIDQPAVYAARLLVRPGLTGWAQVKGGRKISPADKAALDVWYVRNASLALDLEILARTVGLILFGEGIDAVAIGRAWRELRQAGICTSLEPAKEHTRSGFSYVRIAEVS
jgi:lipopolysaccharide/colanic/teichoic acid biosynthesis glycosyltransferase